jgi:Activator of Hsp90 ATPase homolog 1-like protein
MTAIADQAADAPVRKTITVRASQQRAFDVFFAEFDRWWPRSHHIGSSPMKKAIIEGRAGGRCYTEQVDGTECDWGTVLVWDPPHRAAWAWQIDGKWKYQPDLAKSSEVEVRFTALADGSTRVDLEHRHLSRHGDDANAVRTAIDSPNGWGGLLDLYAAKAHQEGR